MITDFLLEHTWLMPVLLGACILLGPTVGAWLTVRPRLAWALLGLSLVPLVALTLVPVDRDLIARCTFQWSLPTPGRAEIFANMVLFVAPVLLAGVVSRRPLLALCVASATSIVVEALQAAIPAIGRSCDSTDWLANSLGALIGAVLASVALALAAARPGLSRPSR